MSGTTGYKFEHPDKKGKGVTAVEYSQLLRTKLIPNIKEIFKGKKHSFIFQ